LSGNQPSFHAWRCEHYVASDDTVPHSMVDDVDVLGGRADSTMLEKREGSLVVSKYGDDRDRLAKVLVHLSEPQCFLGGGTRSIALSLTGGLGNHALELGLTGDGPTVLTVDPSSGGLPAILFSSIVRITETLKGCGGG
jgi:hypothetical protein